MSWMDIIGTATGFREDLFGQVCTFGLEGCLSEVKFDGLDLDGLRELQVDSPDVAISVLLAIRQFLYEMVDFACREGLEEELDVMDVVFGVNEALSEVLN